MSHRRKYIPGACHKGGRRLGQGDGGISFIRELQHSGFNLEVREKLLCETMLEIFKMTRSIKIRTMILNTFNETAHIATQGTDVVLEWTEKNGSVFIVDGKRYKRGIEL